MHLGMILHYLRARTVSQTLRQWQRCFLAAQLRRYLVVLTPPAQSISKQGTCAVGLASLDARTISRGHFLTRIR
jgi:hypothetical protein